MVRKSSGWMVKGTTNILVCSPRHFSIDYEINSWMRVENTIDSEKAVRQWLNFCTKLAKCGAEIHYIEPHPDFPDMVFTANAGLVHKKSKSVILSNFKHEERQGETELFKRWFLDNGYRVIELPKSICFEGEGDALFLGDTLFLGYGFRTDLESHEIVAKALGVDYVSCELVNPYFYHLDTCFMPMKDRIVYFKDAFSGYTQRKMVKKFVEIGTNKGRLDILNVHSEQADEFICNSVHIKSSVITPSYNSHLSFAGYEEHKCDLSEFMKSGGAAKCLTLKL